MSFGKSQGSQQSQQSSQSFIDPAQLPFLSNLRSAAQDLAFSQAGPISAQANQLSSGLLTGGQQFLQGLQGAAGGLAPGVAPALGGLLTFQGPDQSAANALIQGAGQGAPQLLQQSPALQGQVDALQQAIQANLAATSGTIAGQATLQGGTGGSRQALATGLAGQEAQRQFGQGASNLFAQDFATRQALAPQLLQTQLGAGQALQQGALQGSQQQLGALGVLGQLGLGAGQAQTDAALGGLGSLSGLFNLGMSPFAAQFAPLLALNEIIGRPTVLQTSQGTSSGSSESFNFGFGGE
jgi:hypothetical protein